MREMIGITLTWLVCLALVLGEIPPGSNITDLYQDLCSQSLIQLKGVNETGKIGFESNNSKKQHPPCVLRIESCPTCQVIIEPASSQNFDFYCQTGVPRRKHQCSLGCDYLYVFDVHYVNETMRVIRSWDSNMTPFKSESSSVFIVLCHGPTYYQFVLKYRTVKKLQSIQGTSFYDPEGDIQSPFFPVSYHQNFETYEYVFSSSRKGEYITLSFEDWNLDSSSAFYFEDSNIIGPVYGSTSRPNVISNKNTMRVLFNTGQPISEQKENLGFRAVYTFINDRDQFRNSKTNCKGAGYLLDSEGGQIEFSKDVQPLEYFDCIWVIKAQPGYSGLYLKLMKKRLPPDDINPYRRNQIQIRSGLTSNGTLLSTVYAEMAASDYKSHIDSVGFYIRINSTISPSDSVILAYASFKNTYVDDCKQDSSMFVCNNGRCINKKLVCDGYDHCGDNYDETHGCSYGDTSGLWDKSYQYTITIGVIVPMVISVFLIMVICLLFVMIRRCRRARLREAGMNENLPTLSEEVAARRGRRRRRRRRFFSSQDADNPPTYDEAIQNPPGWYDNVAFGTTVDPTLPQPPSYTEAVENLSTPAVQTLPHGSPSSTDSSQSDLTSRNDTHVSSSSSSEEGSPWEVGRRQPRTRQRTETTHVSSSESETEEGGFPQNPEIRNQNIDPSAVAEHTSTSRAQPGSHEGNTKELRKADKYIHKGSSDKVSDKNSWKNRPGPSYCVIPDANKVRSSRSMELLPSMSLTNASTDIDKESPESSKSNQLRTGGPLSPLNGSCPSLSRNLTVYEDKSALAETNLNAYHPQHWQKHKNKREMSSIPKSAGQTASKVRGCEDPKVNSRIPEVVNSENQYVGQSNRERHRSQGDVMVVYDGPAAAAPSSNRSPSRTPAYLLPDSLGNRENGGQFDNQSSGFHGNRESHVDTSYEGSSPSTHSDQKYKSSDQNSRKNRYQQNQSGQDSNPKTGNNTNSGFRDQRLAHLPIIHQIRRNIENTRALQNNNSYTQNGSKRESKPGRDNKEYVNKPDQTGRLETKSIASQDHTGHHRNDRHTVRAYHPDGDAYERQMTKQDQAGHPESETHNSRLSQAGLHGKKRHMSRPEETSNRRNDQPSRPDHSSQHRSFDPNQGQTMQGHISSHRNNQSANMSDHGFNSSHGENSRGYSNRVNSNAATVRLPADSGVLPPVAMVAGQAKDGAISVRENQCENPNPNPEDNAGYLNLYRMGGEDDDIFV